MIPDSDTARKTNSPEERAVLEERVELTVKGRGRGKKRHSGEGWY